MGQHDFFDKSHKNQCCITYFKFSFLNYKIRTNNELYHLIKKQK